MGLFKTIGQFLRIGAHETNKALSNEFQMELAEQELRDKTDKLKHAKEVANQNAARLMQKQRELDELNNSISKVTSEGKKASEMYTNAKNAGDEKESKVWSDILTGLGDDLSQLNIKKKMTEESVNLMKTQVAECNEAIDNFETSIRSDKELIESIKVQEQLNECNEEVLKSMDSLNLEDSNIESRLSDYKKNVQQKADINTIQLQQSNAPSTASEKFQEKMKDSGDKLDQALNMFK